MVTALQVGRQLDPGIEDERGGGDQLLLHKQTTPKLNDFKQQLLYIAHNSVGQVSDCVCLGQLG